MITSYNAKMPQKTRVSKNGNAVRLYNRGEEWYVYIGTTRIQCTDAGDADRIYNNA